MKTIQIFDYTIIYDERMLITMNEEQNILVVVNRPDQEIHCIITFSEQGLLLEPCYNTEYRIQDKTIQLSFHSDPDE